MNIKQIVTIAAIALVGLSANTASASSKSEAYTACKSHVVNAYNGQANVKLKKIRKRNGNLEVKVNIRANGDKFKATCIVDRDGAVSYSSGNTIIAKN